MKYINEITQAYPRLLDVVPQLESSVQTLYDAVQRGNKILICGNGGSSADSDHIAGELMKGFLSSRQLTSAQTSDLEMSYPGEGQKIANQLQQGIPAISLTCHNALMTAVINDQDPTVVFAQQVQALGKAGDVLIAISTSGNSKNVLMAVKVARARGLSTIGLTGQSGGQLAELCDICIRVPANRVDRIQEYHLPVYHSLCAQLEHQMFELTPTCGEPLQRETVVAKPKPIPAPPALIVFDFDGVFTDNKVYTAQDGTETVQCDRRDSLGLNMLKTHGLEMFILTQETNPVVSARAKKMGLPVYSGCTSKKEFLETHLATHDIEPSEVIYMGNDLNDLGAMTLVGYSVAPADAHPKIKRIASLVVSECGGNGAVRSLCEIIIEKLEG